MVTFKLIQLYPGSKPLGYILKPVNNGLTKPDNYYQNGIWFNPSDYPKYWQEVKELTLLEEAKLRYPIGTIINNCNTNGSVTDKFKVNFICEGNIQENEFFITCSSNLDSKRTIYCKARNEWAEIIDDFVLPEKWCVEIDENNFKVLNNYLKNNSNLYKNYNNNWSVKNTIDSDIYYFYSNSEYNCHTSYRKRCYTEITFEQFKKYVLKEETTVNVEEKVVEKDYEILSMKCNKSSLLHFNNVESSINFMLKNDYSIHSVKRLSDGEIFTIGDKVIGYNNSTAKIKTIDLVGEVSLNIGTDKHEGFSLKNLKKAKQPLLITADGVDIFENIIYYGMNKGDLIIMKLNSKDIILNTNRCVTFSTKEKAEEYILMNKPCLSLSDVWDNLKVKDQKEVLKFVKSKLNK